MRRLFTSLLPSVSVLLSAVVLLTVGTPGSAAAATCQPAVKAVPAAVEAADSVVTVTIKRKLGPTSKTPARLAYQARVLSSFRGAAAGTITVLSDKQGAVHSGCRLDRLTVGTTYLLFLTAQGPKWYAAPDMPSSRDVAMLQPQVEAALAPPVVTFSKPLAGTPARLQQVAAPGAALVIIGLLGLLFVRRSPRSHA